MSFLPFSSPSLGDEELAAVKSVFDSGWITTGKQNEALEKEFCQLTGNRYAVTACSATALMHLSLMALNLQPGDEVITPSLTWVSTLNMICLLGAKPIMIDCDLNNLMVTPSLIEAAITPRTRAIIPVHFAGAPFDLDEILALAARYQIPLIQDAAHAVGTHYRDKPIGHRGTAIFSLHAIKNITCGEGGVLVTDDADLAEKVRCLRFHGLAVDAFDRQTLGRRPQAEVITPGYKYNLPDINAAIARVQLSKLEMFIEQRQRIATYYLSEFTEDSILPLNVPDYPHRHAWHLFIVRIASNKSGLSRDQLMSRLSEQGIGSGLHFRAAHIQSYYRQNYPEYRLPNTEWNSERILSLPLFPTMTEADAQRVVATVKQIIGA